MAKTYCVIWRNGGTENFTWNRTVPYSTREEANKVCEGVRRMGYEAFVEIYALSLAIGLPETFEYGKNPQL